MLKARILQISARHKKQSVCSKSMEERDLRHWYALFEHYEKLRQALERYDNASYPAEDLLHDTYVAAFQSIRNRGPPTQPFRWLRGIARNLRYQRKRPSARVVLDEENEPRISESSLDRLCCAEQFSRIMSGWRGLRELDTYVLEQHYGYDRSYAELSEELGRSRESLRTRAYRAKNSVRDAFGGVGEEDCR